MNWEAISAISDIVGAVAVVISLVYVAAQIRQNTKMARSGAKQSLTEAANVRESEKGSRWKGADMLSRIIVVIVFAPIAAFAGPVDETIPEPWLKNGAALAKDQCLAGIDTEIEDSGSPNLTLKCNEDVEGFVGVMQSFDADNYLGKRVRFSALVKSEGIENGWGGLWMRVDNVGRSSSAFDNMQDRPIKGTTDWSKYSVVLDVSQEASGIFFGTLMVGEGQLWIKDLKLEAVSHETPTTGRQKRLEPGNLELAR